MILELHMIQNFSPSNLNRDDTNAPKDCMFGGFRRARISSQCIKRSIRKHDAFVRHVQNGGGSVGIRTKRLQQRLVDYFVETADKKMDEAARVAALAIGFLGLKIKEKEKTEYLLYFGENEISEMADIALGSWEALLAEGERTETDTNEGAESKEKKGKKAKKKEVGEELKPVVSALNAVIGKSRKENRSYAADVALFGRMVADDKNMNVDAACQVAHAISTHKVDMEMDYYTAVDDLLPEEESGSDMIGTVEFNSSCFYRYTNIDLTRLASNLGASNGDLLVSTVKGFIEASIKAIPTGKQNSMAAQNPPGYTRVILRNDGFPWSLSNAFQKPVRATPDQSLETVSIERLNDYYQKLVKVYGSEGVVCDVPMNLEDGTVSLKELLDAVEMALRGLPEEDK